VYYQYDAGTNSGLLMVVAGDEDEHDDGNNGHGNDDDGHDESNPGNSHDDGKVYTLSTGEAMIPFEGEFSNYWIELASCSEEYDDETDEMVNDCTPNRQIVVTSAAVEGGSSGVMFHDADNSGTISEGDMIHILDENAEQFDVRLYSVSADAYSDENPVFEMPGFSGVVGVLALLGAALLRRKA
jgi:PGF-CTERM protein